MRKIALFLLIIPVFAMAQIPFKKPGYNFVKEKIDVKQSLTDGYYLVQTSSISDFCTSTKSTLIRRLKGDTFIIFTSKEFSSENLKSNYNIYHIKNNWKLSSRLQSSQFKKSSDLKLSIQTRSLKNFLTDLEQLNIPYKVLGSYQNTANLFINHQNLKALLSIESCIYIDILASPKTETDITGLDMTVNRVNSVQSLFPGLNGMGHTISIKEQLFDTLDIDLKNRYTLYGNQSAEITTHATQIATLVGGAGNSSKLSRGVVNAITLTSSDFFTLLPDEDAIYQDQSIFTQNHSYGTAVIENFYGSQANAYDSNTLAIPELVHVFSIGNKGDETPSEGPYSGIEGYANMTGNFKLAKNVLTVGAINKEGLIDLRSSKGPAFDGRIKPDLVAYAPQGTSDAAALVSGVAAILQQSYKQNTGSEAPSSLIRASLIVAAEDVGPAGIDFQSGYGNVNTLKSLSIIQQGQYILGSAPPNSQIPFTISVPNQAKSVKLALVWNDLPANAGDAMALVNDLDLSIQDPSAQTWLPWVLDATPNIQSLNAPAQRKEDHLNTIEYISIDSPSPGNYTIQVSNNSLSATQDFSIAYIIEFSNVFSWTYPMGGEQLSNEIPEFLRWENSFDSNITRVEYNINNTGWMLLSDSVTPGLNFLEWDTSSLSGTAQLRVEIEGQYYTSGTFSISKVLKPEILYNCEDTLEVFWESIDRADSYIVKTLGDTYLTTVENTSEIRLEIPKDQLPFPYISVHPVFGNINGIQGQTINYELQGVNCYFRNFFAFMDENQTVQATLNLSTSQNISSVIFEKTNGGVLESIQEFNSPISGLTLQISDANILSGTNFYRARIVLGDGTEILTEEVEIFFPSDSTFVLYPVPATSHSGINVLSRGDNLRFQLIDINGRLIKESLLEFIDQRIELPYVSNGIYIGRIIRDNKVLASRKILISY